MAAAASPASAALSTRDLSGSGGPLTAADLAQALAGPGVTVSNTSYTGAPTAGGTFSGGNGIIGFDEGVVLSSGDVGSVVGPNVEDGKTTAHGTPGDPDLDALVGAGSTQDAAVLEFDLVPSVSTLTFSYVFSSDEYNEFVSEGLASGVNDVFAFFVNGQNCALVPGTNDPVSINTINNGNPYGNTDPNAGPLPKNPELYRNNDLTDGGGSIDTEMDGLTTVLTCSTSVTAGVPNRVKLAIADRGDSSLDSNAFLQKGSFASPPPPAPSSSGGGATSSPPADRDHDGIPDSLDTLDGSLPPVPGKSVVVRVVSGIAFIKLPRGAQGSGRVSAVSPGGGPGFVPLKGAGNVPIGSTVDVEEGRIDLTSAADLKGKTQSANFYAGIFQIKQRRAARMITDLKVQSAGFSRACEAGVAPGAKGATASAARRRSKRVVTSLWGSGHGRFRTRGRFSAATVRGTIWLTQERCDGTLTRVRRGRVAVRDLGRRRTVLVRAGQSYLARATRAALHLSSP